MPAEKPVARLKQEITELPSHSHSENNIMYIKQEIHGRDETVSVQETNNEVIAAKKRGRKKKSESTNTESYSNLRGKRVDYNALITDNNDDEAPKKKRKRNTKTAVEIENDEGSSRQINAVTNETSTETVAAEEDPLALIPVEAPRRRYKTFILRSQKFSSFRKNFIKLGFHFKAMGLVDSVEKSEKNVLI